MYDTAEEASIAFPSAMAQGAHGFRELTWAAEMMGQMFS